MCGLLLQTNPTMQVAKAKVTGTSSWRRHIGQKNLELEVWGPEWVKVPDTGFSSSFPVCLVAAAGL